MTVVNCYVLIQCSFGPLYAVAQLADDSIVSWFSLG